MQVPLQGPYEVIDRMGAVNYRVQQPGRRKPTQLYHINLLKQWRGGTRPQEPTPLVLATRSDIPVVPVGDDYSPVQKQDLDEIILQHQDVFFPRFPREPLSPTTTFGQRQASQCAYLHTGLWKPEGTPSGKRLAKCFSSGSSKSRTVLDPVRSFSCPNPTGRSGSVMTFGG